MTWRWSDYTMAMNANEVTYLRSAVLTTLTVGQDTKLLRISQSLQKIYVNFLISVKKKKETCENMSG